MSTHRSKNNKWEIERVLLQGIGRGGENGIARHTPSSCIPQSRVLGWLNPAGLWTTFMEMGRGDELHFSQALLKSLSLASLF